MLCAGCSGGIIDAQKVDGKVDPQRAAIGHQPGVALVDRLDHEAAEQARCHRAAGSASP
jgi:hypothetical protein